ncbi:MAG: hemolysin family protein [Candidatus Thermoplasmatota archaeon]
MIWIAISLLVILCLLCLSAFFSTIEMAFVSVSRAVTRDKAREGDKHAIILDRLMHNPDKVISAIVIGNNLVNILASILAGVTATMIFGNIGVGLATVAMMVIVIIFCEVTPKTFGMNNMRLALRSARALALITWLFHPMVILVTGISNGLIRITGREEPKVSLVTEREIMAMIRLGEAQGTIAHDEREMVKEVFEFDETRGYEVYTPKDKIVFIHEDETINRLTHSAIETGYSRFPVYRRDQDDVIGMVHVKDILPVSDKSTPVKSIMRPILKVDSSMKADDILRAMKSKKTHLALLQTHDGKTLGLVSMEDLIEEVFGEIDDEYDVDVT